MTLMSPIVFWESMFPSKIYCRVYFENITLNKKEKTFIIIAPFSF